MKIRQMVKKIILLLAISSIVLPRFCYANPVKESNLFSSIVSGDIIEVEALIKDGVNVNAKGPNGFTPLLAACSGNKTDIALLLLDSGADPNLPGNQNETPLLYAVMTANRVIIKELLTRGANPDTKMITGQSPLDMAKAMHMTDIIHLMQSKGSDDSEKIDPNKTVLKIIDSSSLDQAKNDPSKDYCYYLGVKTPIWAYPLRFQLVTPYSVLRYVAYQEKHAFITPDKALIQDLMIKKDYVFIKAQRFATDGLTMLPTTLKNLVVKKNEKIYKNDEAVSFPLTTFMSMTYAFPIGVFDGEPLEIIAIDQNDWRFVIKLSASKIKGLK
jgi:hypothetical protein